MDGFAQPVERFDQMRELPLGDSMKGRIGGGADGPVELRHQPGFEAAPGGALTLAIRPEEITVGPAALHGDNRLALRGLSPETRTLKSASQDCACGIH